MKKLLAIFVRAIITTAEKGYREEEEEYCIYNSSRGGYSNSTHFNCNFNCY
jgi:hypothetical protein